MNSWNQRLRSMMKTRASGSGRNFKRFTVADAVARYTANHGGVAPTAEMVNAWAAKRAEHRWGFANSRPNLPAAPNPTRPLPPGALSTVPPENRIQVNTSMGALTTDLRNIYDKFGPKVLAAYAGWKTYSGETPEPSQIPAPQIPAQLPDPVPQQSGFQSFVDSVPTPVWYGAAALAILAIIRR